MSGTLRIIQGEPTTGKSTAAEAWLNEDRERRRKVGQIEHAFAFLALGYDVVVDDERLQHLASRIEVRVLHRARCDYVGERILNEGLRYEEARIVQCSLEEHADTTPHRWGGKDFA